MSEFESTSPSPPTTSSTSSSTSNSSSSSNIKYGLGNFGSNKISFQQFYLSKDILEYLSLDSLFQSSLNGEDSQLTQSGYVKSIDYPEIPNHIYYEAYFHALPINQSIETMHPRYGMIHDKIPSSLIITSFYETIRRKNKNWTNKLINELQTIPSIASNLLIKILEENRHFAG